MWLFLFLTVQDVGILPDVVPVQLPLWFLLKSTTGGCVGSARVGGSEAHKSRAPSDRKQGDQTFYDITERA